MQLVVACMWLGMRKFGIADPGISGEPLMQYAAERTVSPAKKYRTDAEGHGCDISPSRNLPSGLRASDHDHAHVAPHGSAQPQ